MSQAKKEEQVKGEQDQANTLEEKQEEVQNEEVKKEEKSESVLDKTNKLLQSLFCWKIFFWEMLGTALFSYGICSSDGQDWYVTISLFAAILLVAPFSGGHLNPAVSFGFFIKNGIVEDENTGLKSWAFRELFGRVLAQFAGAILGAATAFYILGLTAYPSIPSDQFSQLGGYFTGEAFGTCIFVITILIMTDRRTKLVDEPQFDEEGKLIERRGPADVLATIGTIAIALHFSRSSTWKTGGGLNPGIAIGLQLWQCWYQLSWAPLTHSWLFLVGPLIGSLVAAYYYSLFHLAATNQTGCFAPKVEKVEEVKNEEEQVQKEGEQNA